MSLKSLPLLFINLGGEMMYILDQRLSAQNIPKDKAKKVLSDILSTMLNSKFMAEIFKPQPIYSKKAMRTVFDRLAHASIMRLNAASMDKLYDLMTMAFKYQVSLALRPKDLLLITLNHIDAMRNFVDGPDRTVVESVYKMLISTYSSMSNMEFQVIRQTLLAFFQDMHIRVSIFLKDKVQTDSGRFILKPGGTLPFGTEVPGIIRSFDEKGKCVNIGFSSGGNYTAVGREGSFDPNGDRLCKLGTNMYSTSRTVETTSSGPQKSVISGSDLDTSNPDPLAKAHLDLLSQLIGAKTAKNEFRLNLFKDDREEEQAATVKPVQAAQSPVVNIDASQSLKSSELTRIMSEMMLDDKQLAGDSDLLDLMDS